MAEQKSPAETMRDEIVAAMTELMASGAEVARRYTQDLVILREAQREMAWKIGMGYPLDEEWERVIQARIDHDERVLVRNKAFTLIYTDALIAAMRSDLSSAGGEAP